VRFAVHSSCTSTVAAGALKCAGGMYTIVVFKTASWLHWQCWQYWLHWPAALAGQQTLH